ncbi:MULTISPECIES: metal ABC transporter ATP-binding protein [unclassified Agarivorans]|uniref:metal ABC transporter ATP-binding protein n=2 Tax=Agarivorans TaxID=261825 RepID=UPI003D7DECA2
MQAIISMDHLSIGYQPHQPIVSDLNAAIPNNGMLALVGSNGAGKSTLLKTLLGLIKPLSGHLSYQINPRQDIAYLPQHLSVERSFPIDLKAFVSTGLWSETGWWRSMRPYQQQVQQALAQVGIEDLATRLLSELSGGQLQRALFARMLLQRSKLLLLDEPFNGVDEPTVEVLLHQLKCCQQNGATIVAAVHDLELVKQHFEHCLLFDAGGITQGRSLQLFSSSCSGQADHPLQELAGFTPNQPLSGAEYA